MPKNNANFPKLLMDDYARKLNNAVFAGTGCFLFLKIPESNLLLPFPTSNGGSNYRYNILSLYKMYCDYGHYFLWFCIQKSNLPKLEHFSDSQIKNDINQIEEEQSRVLNHFGFVANVARHVLAHGIYQYNGYEDPKIKTLLSFFEEASSGSGWPTGDEKWRRINNKIIEEANFLYGWIERWACIWKKCENHTAVDELQNRFYFGRWKYASNVDKCEKIIPEEWEDPNASVDGYLAYDEKSQDLSSFAMTFSYQFVYDAREYLAAAVPNEGVRSEYEENGYWNSNRPNSNVKILYKNINFNGIKNLRDYIRNPNRNRSVCPDCFRLYLEGLLNKMLQLPVINIRPARKSRFSR